MELEIADLSGQIGASIAQKEKEKQIVLSRKLAESKTRRDDLLAHSNELRVRDGYFNKISELENKIATLRGKFEKTTNGSIMAITKLLKNCVYYIPPSLQEKPSIPSGFGSRTTVVSDSTNSDLVKTSETLTPKIRGLWKKAQSEFRSFSSFEQELTIVKNRVMLDESNICVPLHLAGTGTQEIVTLLHELRNEKPILIIEEPEQHLHPDLSKKVLNHLKEVSNNKQVWISTHSPFFLDRKDVTSIFSITKKEGKTAATQLLGKEDLKDAIEEIGVRPSDLLFSDALLLVEGETEKEVIPIWAKTLGLDLDDYGVAVLSIRGAGNGKYHLKMWKEISGNAQIPLFMLLDSHAAKEVAEMVTENLINEDCCVTLKTHSIEENYPKSKVISSIKSEFGIDIKDDELSNTQADIIKTVLTQKKVISGNSWKPVLGRSVAKTMTQNEIPADVRKLFEKIKSTLVDN